MSLENNHLKQLSFNSIAFLVCLLLTIHHTHALEHGNYLVLKNNNIFALNINNLIPTQHIQQSLWISNNQQSLKVQTRITNKDKIDQVSHPNLNKYLPIFSSYLFKKGYLKPLNPFGSAQSQSSFVKGYKYRKPAYYDKSDEVLEQVQAFLKASVESNNLHHFNLRMEDTFQIELVFTSNSSNPIVNSISIRYLFATVSKDKIPKETLDILSSNLISYDGFVAKEKAGSVQRKLQGKGLHQWVNLTLSIDDKIDILLQENREKCFFEFTDILPESTYVDADQRRKETINYEVIDVQKPAFAAKQYFYKYRVDFNELKQSGVQKYSYEQPVHFRYPAPSLLNITKVYLHPLQEARIVCVESLSGKGNVEKVYDLKENILFERGTASIPNGDVSKGKIVSMLTLTVCIVGVLIIINKLKKN